MSTMTLKQKAKSILRKLDREYGRPNRRAQTDMPLVDHLIHTVLSQKTTGHACDSAYRALREAVDGDWRRLLKTPRQTIARHIRVAGLANQKAQSLRAIMAAIGDSDCPADLSHLCKMNNADAMAWLTTFPGVGPKTAACVLLFGMGRDVLPVDTHVHRLARRLELVKPETSPKDTQHQLEQIVSPADRYAMHVNLFNHGRAVCRGQKPKCHECVLCPLCEYPTKGLRL